MIARPSTASLRAPARRQPAKPKPRSFYPRAVGDRLYRQTRYVLRAVHFVGGRDRPGSVRALTCVLNEYGMAHKTKPHAVAAARGIMGTTAGKERLICVDVIRRAETYIGSVTASF